MQCSLLKKISLSEDFINFFQN